MFGGEIREIHRQVIAGSELAQFPDQTKEGF